MPEDIKCPICGSETVERTAKKGQTIYVCNRYPECKGKVSLSEDEDVDGFPVGQEENKIVSKEHAKDIVAEEESSKSRTIALLLCLFLGFLGAHRFYLGKYATAIALLALWVIGILTVVFMIGNPFLAAVVIWALIDLIFIIVGNMKDVEGRLVTKWGI